MVKNYKNDSLVSDDENKFVLFKGAENDVNFRFDASSQEIWATAQNLADLFDVTTPSIRKHILNIYIDKELEQSATSSNFELVQNEGGREVVREIGHYNLDMIISVGYRVNAKRAVEFRKWATNTLRAYIEQGFVINEKALRESPEKLNKLAAQIRALRSEEKQVYEKVRECFRVSSSDYEPSSKQVRSFYALLQDKFHHAVTGLTSSKLIMDRADHREKNMGIQTIKGDFPTKQEARVGKNYLKAEELYRLHLLSEQFLLFAESTALSNKKMTMDSLHNQLDRLLTLNDYPVFGGYTDFIKDEAIRHAEQEYKMLKNKQLIEANGIEYDEDELLAGSYDYIIDPDY